MARNWASIEYLHEDQSQAFRWQDVKIAAFPTVIVQPPRSGRYGERHQQEGLGISLGPLRR